MPFAVSSRLSWLGIGRELITGIPVPPAAAVPVDQNAYEIVDTPGFVFDTGLRASSGMVAGAVLGTLDGAFGFGAPFYLDSAGWWLDNLLGDLSTVSGGTLGTAQPLSLPANVGDTTVYATASLGSVTTGSVVQISDGAASETVIATAGSSGTVIQCAGTPCRFPHALTATAALETAAASYTHTFSVLNSGTGEPPTHTLTDTSGLTAGTGARVYPAAALAQLDLAGDPGQGFITAKLTGASWLSQPASAAPVNPGYTQAAAFPGWLAVVSAGTAAVAAPGAWTVSLKRQTVIYRSAGSGQNPYLIARGPLTATGTLAYPGAWDETALLQVTQDGLVGLQVTATNGLTGTSALALTAGCSAVQFMKPKLSRGGPALAYTSEWQATDNANDAGGSGGIGPVQVQLVNAQAAY